MSNVESNTAVIELREYLKRLINVRGWTKSHAAKELDISRQSLYNTLAGQDISRNLAKKLSSTFGKTSDFWLRSSIFVAEIDSPLENYPVNVGQLGGSPVFLLVDDMIRQAKRTGDIGISHYEEENLRSASYDLTVGSATRLAEGGGEQIIDLNGPCQIQRGETIMITTQEEIDLPISYFARLGAIAEHIHAWLFYSIGLQVDPQFSGTLKFPVMNQGFEPFSIWKGQRILSIEFYKISTPPGKGYQDYSGFVPIFESLKNQYEDALSNLFTSKDQGDGSIAVALEDNNIRYIGTNHDELLAECITDFNNRLEITPDEWLIRYLKAVALSVLLNAEQIKKLFEATKIDYNKETNTITLPNHTKRSMTMPNQGTFMDIDALARILDVDIVDIVLGLLGKKSWHMVFATNT